MLDCMSVGSLDVLTIAPIRRKENQLKQKKKEEEQKVKAVRRVWGILLTESQQLIYLLRPQTASSMFLSHNAELVPPYRVLIDTNFINFSLQNKLELISGMMDCLYAKCTWQLLQFSYFAD